MTTVIDGRSETVSLAAGEQLTVVSVTGAGRIVTGAGFAAVAAGATVLVGPFATSTIHRLEALNGALTYSVARVDFPSATEAVASAAAAAAALYVPVGTGVTIGDVKIYVGAGVPVDYTDGDPVATGEGEAGIGSLYIDTTNGKLYINGGTKAEPLWKIVTSA